MARRRHSTYRTLVIIALIMAVPAGLVACIELYEHAQKWGWFQSEPQ